MTDGFHAGSVGAISPITQRNQPLLNDFRLSLTTDPLPTAAAATDLLRWLPYLGNRVTLWNGINYSTVAVLVPPTLSVAALPNLPHDVYAEIAAGIVSLGVTAWNDDGTRATALTRFDGRLVVGSPTRLYLGTVRPVDGLLECVLESVALTPTRLQLRVWNEYNRIRVPLENIDTTAVAYTPVSAAATWQPWKDNPDYGLNVIRGTSESIIELKGAGTFIAISGTAIVSALAFGRFLGGVYQPEGLRGSNTTSSVQVADQRDCSYSSAGQVGYTALHLLFFRQVATTTLGPVTATCGFTGAAYL